jgi:CMP/dCMP kinase
MSVKKIVIAIDGFSSCGKSTVAKQLASELGYIYIDSGAMYRCVTLYFLHNQIDLNQPQQVEDALHKIHISFHLNKEGLPEVYLNDENVEQQIRTMEISNYVSPVSAIKEVRWAMVKQQQKLGERKGMVMDGRDIGTTVFPNAELKIFLSANPIIRAKRRYLELQAKGEKVTIEEVLRNLAERDRIDSTRAESPLCKAADAIEIDNSTLNREEQLHLLIELVEMVFDENLTFGKKQIEVEKYLWRNLKIDHFTLPAKS